MKATQTWKAAAVAAALVAGFAVQAPANATEPDATSTEPPLTPIADVLVDAGASFDGETDSGTVSIPTSASDPIITTDNDAEVELPLPANVSHRAGELDDDGSVLYTSASADFDIKVVPGSESTRVLTIIDSPDAPTEYLYEFGAGHKVVLDASGAAVVFNTNDSDAPGVIVDAPWAFDDNGATVATRYEVRGTTLVQIVEHEGAAYPVTADPTYSVGWGYYAHFNRAETKTVSTMGWGAAAGATLCGLVVAGGGPAAIVAMTAGCLLVAGTIVYNAGVAQNSSPKKCLYVKMLLNVWTSGTYSDNRCK